MQPEAAWGITDALQTANHLAGMTISEMKTSSMLSADTVLTTTIFPLK